MTDNTSERAILSVTAEDVAGIIEAIREIHTQYDNDGIALAEVDLRHLLDWQERFRAVHKVLTDHIPVHFTNLGTTP